MPPTLYTDEELSPYLARERAAEVSRKNAWREDCARQTFSGMSPGPFEPRSDAEIMERAMAALDSKRRFDASPRGRFYLATEQLRELGYHEEACKLYGLYSRSFADARETLDVKAVAAALIVLDGMAGGSAREATRALHELLLETRPVMMAAE